MVNWLYVVFLQHLVPLNIAMITLAEIRELHIELTTRCNAQCPLCPRNYRGLDFNSGYPVTELSLAQIRQILPADFLPQITKINLNGNLGDFGLATDAREILHYLVDSGVRRVLVNTNGSMRSPSWWAECARPGVEIHFALDGLADTHALYRQQTDWHRIIANAQAVISAGGRAVWQFIPFEHNRHQLEDCRALAQSLGFAEFVVADYGRNTGPVYTRRGEFSHWLGAETGSAPDVHELVRHHLTWFDHRTLRHELDNQPMQVSCLTKNFRTIYIAADGSVYPCCYLGFYPGQMQHPGNAQTAEIMQENNALVYGLQHSLGWFSQVEASWSRDSVSAGRLYTCAVTCGHQATP